MLSILYRHSSRKAAGPVALLLASLALLPGCFISNRIDPDTHLSDPVTTVGGTVTESDGAQGQCLTIDKSRPERLICVDCYGKVLASRCPGQSDPSGCLDSAVKTNFTNLVNQCILQTLTQGTSCSLSCQSGLVLDRTSCTCVVPENGVIPPPDSGQTNYGPPVVELDWPGTYVASSNTTTSCKATMSPVRFQVQNRGDTVPQFNQYAVEGYSCTNPGLTGYIDGAPIPQVTSGTVQTSFGVSTTGSTELFSKKTVAIAPKTEAVLQDKTQTATLTWADPGTGTYLLNFDLVLADNWIGDGKPDDTTNGPHGVKLTQTSAAGTPILLNATFSTKASYSQSFPGDALAKGINFEGDDGPDAKFRIAIPLSHTAGAALSVKLEPVGTFPDPATTNDPKWRYMNATIRPLGLEDFSAAIPLPAANGPWSVTTREADPTKLGYADFTEFHGVFKGADSTTFTADYVPSGKYLLSFDFYVLDTWVGEGVGLYAPYPRMASALATATAITAGASHNCALQTGAPLSACWGENEAGQLGTNSVTDSETPTLPTLPGGVSLAAIDAGTSHTCAVGSDSKVYCWGYNGFGQLGLNSTTDYKTPQALAAVPGGAGVPASVSAGDQHTCGIYAGPVLGCWGRNNSGQLGDGTVVNKSVPTAVALANVTQVSAGGQHTCARTSDGKVHCWGEGSYGQVGDTLYADHVSPFEVPGIAGADEVAAGGAHSCARIGGAIKCWGDNSVGQLGNGQTTSSGTPVAVTGIANAKALSAGETHTCAVVGDYDVYCWGSNTSGKLGDGTIDNRSTPVKVQGLAISNTAPIVKVTAVAAGSAHSCALLSSGKVQCWGSNASKQLANTSLKSKFKILYGAAESTLFDQSFSNTEFPQSYRGQATILKTNLGYLDTPDSIYRLNVLVDHTCAADPCDLTLKFTGDGLDETRGWGIDNFGIVPASQCGITYTFTDSNQLSSRYCLRFNPLTSCGQTPSNPGAAISCECWARPSTVGLRPYFAPLTPNESCP